MNKRIFIPISIVLAVGAIVLGVLYAQETGKLKDAQTEIIGLEGNLSALETELANADAEISTIETKLTTAKAEVSALEAELAAAELEEETGIPGNTLADLQFQNDVLAVIMNLERVQSPNCANLEIINSEVTENVVADGTWGERWTLNSCGVAVAYDIRFVPNDIGETFSNIIRVEASTPTLLEQVIFPDANLETAIREAINKPKGTIYTFDLESLTVLRAWDKGISDLTGLEYCLELRWLELANNNINDISPLAGLTDLYWLNFGGNNISDISALAGLIDMEGLYLWGNSISDISPLVGLVDMYFLDLFDNNVSDISILANIGELHALDLGDNNISDILPLLENSELGDVAGHGHSVAVNLNGNPLSTTSVDVYLPQLAATGIQVIWLVE